MPGADSAASWQLAAPGRGLGAGGKVGAGTRITNEEPEVLLCLSERELRLVIAWKEGGTFFPDEERVLRKLRRALEAGDVPDLSRIQLQVIRGWGEERVGGRYGGGEVLNPEEAAILGKVREALRS